MKIISASLVALLCSAGVANAGAQVGGRGTMDSARTNRVRDVFLATKWGGTFQCVQCTVHVLPTGTWVEFGAEPVVLDATTSGGVLRNGDVIVAVDSVLVTTPEGSRRLTSFAANQPKHLTVRRDGKEIEVTLTPRLTYKVGRGTLTPGNFDSLKSGVMGRQLGNFGFSDRPTFRATSPAGTALRGRLMRRDSATGANGRGAMVPGRMSASRAGATAWLGFGIECRDCSISTDSAGTRWWRFATPPTIAAVDSGGPAERGGVMAGDLLRAVDGQPITSTAGARRFSLAKPGERLRLTLDRKGKIVEVVVVVARVN